MQVVAPPAMTLHKPATVTILVKNSGPTDAYGVVVRDELPPGAKFLKAQPEPLAPPPADNPGGLVVWNLGTLSAGAEKQLKMTVEPVQKGPMDHAATVTLASGSRAKTVVLEPVLRVEQTVSRTNVLKGQQVQFDITITNDGDGPAHNVIVRADLSPGLKHETEGNILELDLGREFNKPVLQPRESLKLPTLVVDAVGEGQSTCTVKATSEDVVADAPRRRPSSRSISSRRC